jgi:hypothetical protein
MSNAVTITLRKPVEWTKTETVTELVLAPTARFYRDVALTMGPGGLTYKPYDLAVAGVRLAGRAAAEAFVDKMDPADMNEVANTILSFLNPAPTTGG